MRKRLSFLLTIVVLVSLLCIPVSASYSAGIPTAIVAKEGATPHYSVIGSIMTGFDMTGSKATCDVTFNLYDTYKYRCDLWLQRSSNGGVTYSDYVRLVSVTATDRGSCGYTKSKSGLNTAYEYATHAKITVYDSDGSVIDIVNSYSYD